MPSGVLMVTSHCTVPTLGEDEGPTKTEAEPLYEVPPPESAKPCIEPERPTCPCGTRPGGGSLTVTLTSIWTRHWPPSLAQVVLPEPVN